MTVVNSGEKRFLQLGFVENDFAIVNRYYRSYWNRKITRILDVYQN